MSVAAPSLVIRIRDLEPSDLPDVIRIDAAHAGSEKPEYWASVLRDFRGRDRVRLAAESGGRVVGHLLGEVRAFEFGSEPCGWVFAVGVDPAHLRRGVAAALLREACRRFARAGIRRVRTMVRREDVPLLSFFRSAGMVGGPFVQLERTL
jgi:ribosomal protein S18 acetylase RimI-like enzyme